MADRPPPDDAAWLKRPDETSRAYTVFCVYRDQGPRRSLRKVHDEVYGEDAGNIRYVEKWSSRFDWVDRAGAYDEWEAEEVRQVLMAERLRERENRIQLLKGLRTQLARALRDLNVKEMSPADLLRGIDIATKQLRKEYDDEPKRRLEVTGEDGDPLDHRHSAADRLMEALEEAVEEEEPT